MKQKITVFTVKGIFCPKCVQKLQETLNDIAGLETLDVSDDFQTVTVRHDEKILSAQMLQEKIEAIPEKDFVVVSIKEE